MEGSIKQKVVDKIKLVKLPKTSTSIHRYDDFDRELTKLLGSSAKKNDGIVAHIKGWAKRLENQNNVLMDEYIQALRADLVERRRYLRYRVYTALGIASVILITGFLAQKFGIPLPMLRITP